MGWLLYFQMELVQLSVMSLIIPRKCVQLLNYAFPRVITKLVLSVH